MRQYGLGVSPSGVTAERLRRLEATGVQRRKVTKKNKGDFDVSYPDSAMLINRVALPLLPGLSPRFTDSEMLTLLVTIDFSLLSTEEPREPKYLLLIT